MERDRTSLVRREDIIDTDNGIVSYHLCLLALVCHHTGSRDSGLKNIRRKEVKGYEPITYLLLAVSKAEWVVGVNVVLGSKIKLCEMLSWPVTETQWRGHASEQDLVLC